MPVQTKSRSTVQIEKIRKEFPILAKKINRKPIIYFDNAATGQKPQVMIDRLQEFYTGEYGKPRENYELGKEATSNVEEARKKVAKFIGCNNEKNIIFTRGCTESINIVAGGFAKGVLKKGDEVLITVLEHHANIIPWQFACEQTGALLKVIPVTPAGQVVMENYKQMLSRKTKIVSISHSSHVLGTILPVKEMIRIAHEMDIPVLVDGAQTVPHMPIDVEDLDCDFYTFSGHKMGAPTGIGILYGKRKWLNELPPFEGGSDMASKVSFEKTEYAPLPEKFEAGTMPFADIIAFGTVIDFLQELNMEKLFKYEQELLKYAMQELTRIDGINIVGKAPEKEAVISFYLDKRFKKDEKELETFLSEEYNIFIKSGNLNAEPLLEEMGVKALARISFSYYNTKQEVDVLVDALNEYMKKINK